jgi:phosphoglucosamine mutase
MPKYFGTDGIRGKSPEWLNDKMAYAIGYGLGHGLKVKRLLVARDTRASGVLLKDALIAGALSQKIEVADLGIISTPMLAYLTIIENCFGVMITASHNQASDNGIKVINKGHKTTASHEEILESYFDLPLKHHSENALKENQILLRQYLDDISNLSIPKSNLNVVLDTAHGALSHWAEQILRNYANIINVIGNTPNGKNINDGVGSTQIDCLIKATPKGSIGLAFDGDGDRLLCVDEEGQVVTGDQMLGILGLHLLTKPATIAFTQMLNPGIKHALNQKGIHTLETKVGDKYVMAALYENNLSIGGEDSGHMIFKSFWPLGDGIISAILIIKLMVETNSALADLSKDFQPYSEKLVNIRNIPCSMLDNNEFIKSFEEMSSKINSEGKVLLRPSGTEPVVRLYASHPNQELLNKFIDNALSLFESFGGTV